MKILTPNYYKKFKCIAAKCKHNCCIGWEIDIDLDTLTYYQSLTGSLGDRLKNRISLEDTPHFILGKGERCPFLNADNLCDIITEIGEKGLCSICADHPRFRNEFFGRTELGLGLCCEAAGRLILSQTKPTKLVVLQQGEEVLEPAEEALLQLRSKIFALLQDRSLPLQQRLDRILAICGGMPAKSLDEWKNLFCNLERMDPTWDTYLDRLKEPTFTHWEVPLENAATYFTYRHLAGALEDGLLTERIRFIVLSVLMLAALAEDTNDFDELVEIARLYSAEIEYSDQNVDLILQYLS